MPRERWESAYLATSAILGEPLEDAMASLSEEGAVRCAELLRRLRAPSRDERARVLATAISEVARAVDAASLA